MGAILKNLPICPIIYLLNLKLIYYCIIIREFDHLHSILIIKNTKKVTWGDICWEN